MTFGLKSDVLNFNPVFPHCHGWYFFPTTVLFFNCSFQFDVGCGRKPQALLIQYMLIMHYYVPGTVVGIGKQMKQKRSLFPGSFVSRSGI